MGVQLKIWFKCLAFSAAVHPNLGFSIQLVLCWRSKVIFTSLLIVSLKAVHKTKCSVDYLSLHHEDLYNQQNITEYNLTNRIYNLTNRIYNQQNIPSELCDD